MHDSVRNTFQDPTLIWSVLKMCQYIHILHKLISDAYITKRKRDLYVCLRIALADSAELGYKPAYTLLTLYATIAVNSRGVYSISDPVTTSK
jgi:hypothetical protein